MSPADPKAEATPDDEDRQTAADLPLPGGNFRLFVQKLTYQALMSMGIVENPLTQTKDRNLMQAQTVIDDLMMLRDKTEGNLDPDEAEHLQKIVRELQQHFVKLRQQEEAQSGPTEPGPG